MTRKAETKSSGQLDAALKAERKREDELQGEVTAIAERLGGMKRDYEKAVEAAEGESKLDARDEQIIRAERELTRAQIKLSQCRNEIQTLEAQKAEAEKAEREATFLEKADAIFDDLVLFEISFGEFLAHKTALEGKFRDLMNSANAAGRDASRLHVDDRLRQQLTARIRIAHLSKNAAKEYSAPLNAVLESHIRNALDIPLQGKATINEQQTERLVSDETRTERSLENEFNSDKRQPAA